MISPVRKLVVGVCPSLVLIAISVFASASDAVARPALAADDPAAVGAKSSEGKLIEIPGSFKNPAGAASNPASKSVPSSRKLQKSDMPISVSMIDGNKLVNRGTLAVKKTRTIRIPVSLIEKDRLHDFNATAYCLRGRTASGHNVRQGVIAADPSVLPIGTVVHLQAGEYSGVYTVLDTGGRIKGRVIDVYVPTRKEALNFGRRQVKLKIIGTTPAITESSAAAGAGQF